MKTHFQLVGEFHIVFDYPVRDKPYFNVFQEDPKLLQSRLAFVREERDEFLEALEKSDLVEMADALCDLNYFAYGSGQCFGINLDRELELANHSKITNLYSGKNVDSKILRQKEQIYTLIDIVTVHINQFEKAITTADFEMVVKSLTSIIISTYELGYYLNFDMDKMFREVHRSNMTKVCHNMRDAKESLRLYLEEARYKTPVIRTKEPYFLIYDEDLNKILKCHKWEVPNLCQFMGPEFLNVKV